jgi:NADPH:quinone reductase-like Zn-dependent oxidoreductase
MKAWELQDRGFDNLRLVERPTPQPGPHDLLVRVSAVSLNHHDEDIILGDYFPQQPQLSQTPLIIVSDAAGIVAEAGVEVSRFKEGDRVTTHLFSRWIDGEPGPHEEKYSLGGPAVVGYWGDISGSLVAVLAADVDDDLSQDIGVIGGSVGLSNG